MNEYKQTRQKIDSISRIIVKVYVHNSQYNYEIFINYKLILKAITDTKKNVDYGALKKYYNNGCNLYDFIDHILTEP